MLASAPLGGAVPREAAATDYASAAEVFAAIDRMEREVTGRLRAIERRLAGAAPFVASALADHTRHGRERERLRARLRLPVPLPAPGEEVDASLPGLRAAQQALVHAHAEGLPALPDAAAVDALAGHLVDLSRHLAVIDLWLEAEEQRG